MVNERGAGSGPRFPSKPNVPPKKPAYENISSNSRDSSSVIKKTDAQNLKPGVNVNNIPRTQVSSRGRIRYPFASKKSLREIVTDFVPTEFIPTKRVGYIFATLFVVLSIFSLFFIPLGNVLQGNITDVNLTVGFPLTFFNMQLENPERFPVGWKEFWSIIFDGLLYLLIAYVIDVIMNYTQRVPPFAPPKDKDKRPSLYKESKKPGSSGNKVAKTSGQVSLPTQSSSFKIKTAKSSQQSTPDNPFLTNSPKLPSR